MTEFKFIPDFPNYLIYNDGSVFSMTNKKFLKLQMKETGYFFVRIHYNGIHKNLTIHQLLAKAFIPNPDNKPVVDHVNGIRTDNRLENLRWCTYSNNNRNSKKQTNYGGKKTSSRFKGVNWSNKDNSWRVRITVNNKVVGIGYWQNEIDAGLSYNYFACLVYGEFAVFNDVSFEEGSPDLMERLNDIQVRLNL